MWNADALNLYFCQHWFHMVPFFHTLFTPFSHDFHTHSPSSATMKFSCFSSKEKDFCLPSSFSVIHVSLNIKNNIEKLTNLFFFSPKVWVAMRFSPVAFGLPDLLIELIYIGVPVVQMDSRSLWRCMVTWLPNFLGWVDLLSYIWGSARACPWSSAIINYTYSTEDKLKILAVKVMAHLLDTSNLKWEFSHFHQQPVILIHIIEGIKINFFS